MGAGGQRGAGPAGPEAGEQERRRSGRVAKLEEQERAVALAATKEYFAEMGRELMAQEDAEGEERFAEEIKAEETRQGRVCILLDPIEQSDDEEDDSEEESEEEEEAEAGAAALLAEAAEESGGDEDEDEDWEMPESRYEVLSKAPKAFVPEAAASAFEAFYDMLGDTIENAPGGMGMTVNMAWDAVNVYLEEVSMELKPLKGLEAAQAAFQHAFAVTMTLATPDEERTLFGLYDRDDLPAQVPKVLTRLASLWGQALKREAKDLDLEPESLEAILQKLGRTKEVWKEQYGISFPVAAEAGKEGPPAKRARPA